MILGLNRVVLAEGLRFADSIGVNTRDALRVLLQTAAASRVMEGKGLRMVESRYDPPQARLSQHLKDVQLMLKEAGRTGAKIPLTQLHQELLNQAIALGFGESDNSAIIEVFTGRANWGKGGQASNAEEG
jgi:3-hydroxyisobutyrate dehydrogenase-like beta-hydroxyacid dehydrogenase